MAFDFRASNDMAMKFGEIAMEFDPFPILRDINNLTQQMPAGMPGSWDQMMNPMQGQGGGAPFQMPPGMAHPSGMTPPVAPSMLPPLDPGKQGQGPAPSFAGGGGAGGGGRSPQVQLGQFPATPPGARPMSLAEILGRR